MEHLGIAAHIDFEFAIENLVRQLFERASQKFWKQFVLVSGWFELAGGSTKRAHTPFNSHNRRRDVNLFHL